MKKLSIILASTLLPVFTMASEADLPIPDLSNSYFQKFGMNGHTLLAWGIFIIALGMGFGLWQFMRIKKLPAHKSMLAVSEVIYQTFKTYLYQQGKFLVILFAIIGAAIFYYFFGLNHMEFNKVMLVLLWSILGILGSYGVAWFGIRINTLANS